MHRKCTTPMRVRSRSPAVHSLVRGTSTLEAVELRSRSMRKTRLQTVSRNFAASKRAAKPMPSLPPAILRRQSSSTALPRVPQSSGARSFRLTPLQHLSKTRKLFAVDTLIFQDVHHKFFVRIAEEAADQVPDLGEGCFLALDHRRVHERTSLFDVLHISLFFGNSDCGQYGVVSQGRGFR